MKTSLMLAAGLAFVSVAASAERAKHERPLPTAPKNGTGTTLESGVADRLQSLFRELESSAEMAQFKQTCAKFGPGTRYEAEAGKYNLNLVCGISDRGGDRSHGASVPKGALERHGFRYDAERGALLDLSWNREVALEGATPLLQGVFAPAPSGTVPPLNGRFGQPLTKSRI